MFRIEMSCWRSSQLWHPCLCTTRLRPLLTNLNRQPCEPAHRNFLTPLALCMHPCPFADADGQCKYYTVQSGDTLDAIAGYFGVPSQDIKDNNPGVDPSTGAVNSFVKLPWW